MDACLSGQVAVETIDDAVQAWHEGDDCEPLRESLGFTIEEYALWMANPSCLPEIIERRRVM